MSTTAQVLERAAHTGDEDQLLRVYALVNSASYQRATAAAYLFAQCVRHANGLPTEPMAVPDGHEGDAIMTRLRREGYTVSTRHDDAPPHADLAAMVGRTGRRLHAPGCC